ncbi:MAG: sensor histidine kinase, partial [Clostridium sp.]|uniref:sensor histidine kinase n=1 Tax=Clostridium sp. TaxID=1506 RepID=UPI003F37EB91
KRSVIALVLINLSVFGVTSYLHNKSLEGIFYGFILGITVSIILGVYDFYKYNEKINKVKNFFEDKNIEIDKETEIEKLYKKEFLRVIKENKDLEEINEKTKNEIINYYTLWVHQIKTPIASMSLLTNNLEGTIKGEFLEELFKTEEYVGMALNYVRLTEGESDLVIKRYDLDKLLKSAIKKYARLFIRKGLRLNLKEVDKTLITDEKWFLFGIDQILSNSLKYTKKGEIAIYLEGDKLIIKDTGIGIEKEDLKRIFDKGFTGFNGRRDKKATGLGLYLAKESFYKAGCSISIDSEIGVGTKVSISLKS